MGKIVKFLALGLTVVGCGAVTSGGALAPGGGHPLLRVHAYTAWESGYAPQPSDPPPARPTRATPQRSKPSGSLVLKPGEVPTGLPTRLALATPGKSVPADAAETPEADGDEQADDGATDDATTDDATTDDETTDDATTDDGPKVLALSIHPRHASLVDDARALIGKSLEPAAFLAELVETTTVSSSVAERAAQNPVRDLFMRLRRQKKTFEEGSPRVGDLVFFHNTRDLNADNRNNDWYSSVGVVSQLDDDGTIGFIGPGPRDVQEMRLNLVRPRTRRDEKRQLVLNDYVRPKKLSDPAVTQYLAGELFAGFGRL